MQEKMNLKIQEFSDGKILVSSIENDFGSLRQTHEFKTRKELADYITGSGQASCAQSAPAAPPYPSNQANLQNIVSGVNCANTPFMNAMASKQFNCTPPDAPNVIRGEIGALLANHFAPKEVKKTEQSSDERLRAFFNQAQALGYQGRVLDYISALKAAKGYLNSQNADNLQDDGK